MFLRASSSSQAIRWRQSAACSVSAFASTAAASARRARARVPARTQNASPQNARAQKESVSSGATQRLRCCALAKHAAAMTAAAQRAICALTHQRGLRRPPLAWSAPSVSAAMLEGASCDGGTSGRGGGAPQKAAPLMRC